jgi:Na+/melibiose symporter-like transporter
MSALGLPLIVHLPAYFVQGYGLEMTLVGQIFLLARCWDICTDPVAGVIQDRTRARISRKTWLALGVPFTVAGAWLVFFAPFGTGAVQAISYLFALYAGFTICQIAHLSWGAELYRDYHGRSRVQAWREFANVAGMLGVLALPALLPLLNPKATSADAIAIMGWFVIIGLPLAVLVALWLAPERKLPQAAPPRRPTQTVVQRVRSALATPGIARLLGVDFLLGFAPGVTGALFLFFATNALGLGRIWGLLLLLYFAGGLCGVPLWLAVALKFGKVRTFVVANLINVGVMSAVFFMPAGQPVLAAVFLSLAGLSYGAGPFLMRAMMADLSDKDVETNGERRTSFLFALLALTGKAGLAVSVITAYPIVAAFGFDPAPGASNTDSALQGLRLAFTAIPALAYGAAAVLALGLADARRR